MIATISSVNVIPHIVTQFFLILRTLKTDLATFKHNAGVLTIYTTLYMTSPGEGNWTHYGLNVSI